ncbi:hypothetical protein AOY20_08925 [Acinetobacter equi]|uniref:Fimbrial protein n=2 Tax=Acinetobacter equi TaxID=1324350 RepID=A0A0N9VWQ9_9GAMM|nr:hypothetical protein AOY20_08925 [Acinetobacter equi]
MVCTFLYAASEEFNTDFLLDLTDKITVEVVRKGYVISPGVYSFTVNLNNVISNSHVIRFYQNIDNAVEPCFDQNFIDHYQIVFDKEEYIKVDNEGCYDLKVIPKLSMDVDAAQQKINLSIPQVNLVKNPKDYIPPELFDEGINAFILNYNINSYYILRQNKQHENNIMLFLNGGFNYGAWRYRNQSVLNQYTHGHQYQTISNKFERNIIAYQARLELGDTATNSDVFDSFNFRGVQFSTDEAQINSRSQRYAPVIRGIALSNAVVEVRQNGYLIYSTQVSAGKFTIDDLYAANESGDLEITINESDGRVEKFTQAYSSVPNMIRPSQYKYQMTIGQYRSGNTQRYNPYLAQMTYSYGLNNWISPYGGILMLHKYSALLSGVAWSLGKLGAVSLDMTFAQNKLIKGMKKNGTSFKFLYSKSLNELGTNLRLIGYRYSTSNYSNLADAIEEKLMYGDHFVDTNIIKVEDNNYSSIYSQKKNQAQISLNQNLDRFGQCFFNFSQVRYWQKHFNSQNWQMGYSNNFKNLSYSLYYQKEKSKFSSSNYIAGFSFSFLFDTPKILQQHSTSMSENYQYSPNVGNSIQTSLSGSFLTDQRLGVQLQVAQFQNGQNDFSISSNYMGSKQNLNFSYTYNSNYQKIMGGISGGVLVYKNRIVFGKSMYNSPILIEAKGAEDVRIENQQGLKIDKSGYAIISNVSPYIKNRIALNGEDLGQDVIVAQSVINDVIPTKMAIIKVKFDIQRGKSILAHLNYQNYPLVTGAFIIDDSKRYVGTVGLNGQAYLAAVQDGQHFIAKWGESEHQQCTFVLPKLQDRIFGYEEINLECIKLEKN